MKNSEGQDHVITLHILKFFSFDFFLPLSLLFTSTDWNKYISVWIISKGLNLGTFKIAQMAHIGFSLGLLVKNTF